jgi:hypothetical protein
LFAPQQYADPATVIPQLWFCPATTDTHVFPPLTATGVPRTFVVPSPT